MLDNRIYTFLELCNVMNYHKTAQNLNMTQPAVTQHIKYLEGLYSCRLFEYTGKRLHKTKNGAELERYARSILSLNRTATQRLELGEKIPINIGATKTIGEYSLNDKLAPLMADERYEVNIIIDNTEKLTERLNRFELDLLLMEGYVDKGQYLHRRISKEEIVGICSKNHRFAGRAVELEQIFEEKAVLREKGSGTRAVFENFLQEKGYTTDRFANKSVISSNKLIESAVQNIGVISFVYSIIPKGNKNLATFSVCGESILHEFNYIYIDEERAAQAIRLLER